VNTKSKIKDNIIVRIISKIFSFTILSLLILVAGFLIYYVISAQIYAARGEKFTPKFSLFTIISQSMEPNIKVYDVVFDERVDNFDDVKVGDVITFISTSSLSEGATITHRVKDIIIVDGKKQFRTKGDNNLVPDSSLVTQENVIGKVLFKLPQLGRVQFLLKSKGGWLFAILIPALGIVIYDILKIFKLTNIKKKVDLKVKVDNSAEELAKKQAEEKRKQDLINKLNPEKDMSEVIELPIKKEEFIANANKEKTSDDDFELPKLK